MPYNAITVSHRQRDQEVDVGEEVAEKGRLEHHAHLLVQVLVVGRKVVRVHDYVFLDIYGHDKWAK
jgi:hypothetical protein